MSTLDALTRAIDVMARLRAPGGCPWDAEQTHESLARYAIEEAHEVAQAAEAGEAEELQEELGDLLLQVLFHSEIAAESGTFTLEDVARTLTAKLIRRHPHVFADTQADTAQEVERNWEEIKRQEKPRAHPLAGIPTHLPALMRAQKVLSRATKNNLPPPPPAQTGDEITEEAIGAELLATVQRAEHAGIDAEGALRGTIRDLETFYDLPQPR